MNPQEFELAFMGMNFTVQSDESSDFLWLKDFFEGAFDFDPEGASGSAVQRVSLSRDFDALEEARNMAGQSSGSTLAFVLDTEVQHLPSWKRRDGALCAYSDFYDVLYTRQEEIQIFDSSAPCSEGRRARGGLMRAIREQAMDHIWRCGDSILHGGGFAIGDRAVLIAGDKRSGKTSLLCAALTLLSEAQFLANDRIALSVCGTKLTARSIPTIISLRKGSLEVVPGLAGRTSTLNSYYNGIPLPHSGPREKIAMTTRQFASIMEVDVAPSAAVQSIIFPTLDTEQETFALRRLDENESLKMARNAIFAKSHLGEHSELFACPDSGAFPSSEVLLERLAAATADVPSFELRMGPRFYAQPEIARFAELIAG